MAQTNILLEAGTNELEVVEFYLDEATFPTVDAGDVNADPQAPAGEGSYRGYYGVNVAKVLEIIRMPKVTELPEVQHPSVLGAFNLRSRIIPLVDLAMWLGKTHTQTDEQPKTIVTEFNNVTTAFMVSGVNRIHRISWEKVEQPNKYVAAVSNNTVIGVVKLEERIVFLLDLEKVVEKAGFTVEVVENGREAWERLEDFKRRAEEGNRPITDFVHVMVSDIEMPVMDGLNLTHRIKTDPMLKQLPVVLFSSLITDKLRHKGESVGADDQISKPEVTQLAKRALALIKDRERAQTGQA